MPKDLTPFLLQHAPWSLSKVEAVKQCPLKFKYGYVNKPDKAALKRTDNFDSRVGKAVHKLLEMLVLGHKMESAIQFVTRENKLVTREIESLEASRPAAEKFISTFNAFRGQGDRHELLTEKKIAAGFSGDKKPFFEKWGSTNTILLRGVIDVGLIYLDKPTAIIIDHKTGKNKGIAHYANQLDFYAFLVKSNYPHVMRMIPAIHWVQDKQVENGADMDLSRLDVLMDKVVQFMLDATETIDGSKLDNTQTGVLCSWCDYYALCPEFATHVNGAANDQEQEKVLGGVECIGPIKGLNT
jgi:RecB family exonuclease